MCSSDLPGIAAFAEPQWIAHKVQLPIVVLLHALALTWLVARFVPRTAAWMQRGFTAWLAMIGRHSLEVFCLGLFLSWGAGHLLALAPWSWTLDLGLTATGAVGLGLLARWLDGRRATVVTPARPAQEGGVYPQ